MVNRLYQILLIIAIIFSACSNTGETDNLDTIDPDTLIDEKQIWHKDQIDDIIQSFPSPVEMAALIKEAGVPFSLDILMPTDNADGYVTDFQKAMGLGMLGVNLGYLNMYNETAPVINYITIIKKLSDGMQVGQFFDFETLKRLSTNNENIDSLMYISVNSFNQMDSHLRNSNRNSLSSLMIAGVWLEGLYLATQVVKENPNKEIAERIGEQKIILNDIIVLLRLYKDDKNFAELIKDLETIKEAYKDVKITFEIGEPESIEQDGRLIIVQNDTSIITITDEQLNNIIKITEQIRNKQIAL